MNYVNIPPDEEINFYLRNDNFTRFPNIALKLFQLTRTDPKSYIYNNESLKKHPSFYDFTEKYLVPLSLFPVLAIAVFNYYYNYDNIFYEEEILESNYNIMVPMFTSHSILSMTKIEQIQNNKFLKSLFHYCFNKPNIFNGDLEYFKNNSNILNEIQFLNILNEKQFLPTELEAYETRIQNFKKNIRKYYNFLYEKNYFMKKRMSFIINIILNIESLMILKFIYCETLIMNLLIVLKNLNFFFQKLKI